MSLRALSQLPPSSSQPPPSSSQPPLPLPHSGQHYDNQQQQQHHQQPEDQMQEHFKRANSSLNLLSFGFLATAVLISVFLVAALLERFLHRHPVFRSRAPISTPLTSPAFFDPPFTGQPSQSTEEFGILIPEKRYSMGVSVLMPGQSYPTFIAHPAPIVYEIDDGIKTKGSHNASTPDDHQGV